MIKLYIKVDNHLEELESYCRRMSKKNNSVLYKLENYLNKKLMSDVELVDIRDTILTVSADLSRLSTLMVLDGDDSEGL